MYRLLKKYILLLTIIIIIVVQDEKYERSLPADCLRNRKIFVYLIHMGNKFKKWREIFRALRFVSLRC